MIKAIIFMAIGAAFGMSKYGQPTKEHLKKMFTIEEAIVKFSDGEHGIRCTWAGITFYKNLGYTGNDPVEKWMFKSDYKFSINCKGTLADCKNAMKNVTGSETVVEETVVEETTE